jgi:protein SCO1/2
MRKIGSDLIFTVFVSCLVTVGAFAQSRSPDPGLPAATLPAALREVGFDQNLDQQIPVDIELTDELGRPVRLGGYFRSRPVVLAFVYYGCPMLCGQSLSSLASTLGVMSLEPGRDFEVLSISIDPRETPSLAFTKKAHYIERTGKPSLANGWHFLTGTQTEIDRVTRSAGFRYVWDESAQQFAHPAGIVVLTPAGRVARYLFGIDYGARDLQLALGDASENRIGSPIQKALLYCYHYDPATGRYSLAIMRIVQIAGLVTVLSLCTLILVFTRRERREVT